MFAISLWISAFGFQTVELPIATIRNNALFSLCWLKHTPLHFMVQLALAIFANAFVTPGLIHVIHN